jgi:enoyl-CoA hydratase
MAFKYVLYQKKGLIARITLNRPDKLNVIDFPGDGGIFDDFMAALDKAAADDELKVVIIKGAGRAFCAGHDLQRIYHVYEEKDKEPGKRRPSQRARLNIDRQWLAGHQKILLFPKVTIAQVHGHCIGEGACISEMSDIVIVADDAHISHAEQRLGFAGSGLNLVPLFQMIGYKKARELVLTGRAMDGKEAERIGWATKAVPFAKLEEEVEKMAQEICLLPYDGIAIGKASNHMILDILGLTQGWLQGYLTHTMFTNLRFEESEYNFVRQRREEGVRTGVHKRDERYTET